jgi:ABC-2 type transport system ATP-binding protein
MSLIEIQDLTKEFGTVRAVDDLSFEVEAGRIVAFLGPNGSGKTTTLRSLLGLVTPTAGTATIRGRTYGQLDDPLREVGVMLEATAHPARTARNHLRVIAAEARVPRSRVGEVLELVDLAEAADRKVGGFSLGMRQRLGLAGALIGDPEILVLDEPANGLDPEGIRWLRGFLRELAANGRTILLSSHVLAEVAQTADEAVVISSGRLVAHAPIEELTSNGHTGRIRLRSPELARLGTVLRESGMAPLDGGDDEVLTVAGASREAIGQLAFDHRIVLHELTAEGSSLEDVFLTLTATTTTEEVAR